MSFDRLAPHYSWMEAALAGSRLQRSRTAHLAHFATARRVLVAGVGHGHFVRECARRHPAAAFTCVDASRAMLVQAQRRLRAAQVEDDRLEFVQARLPDWQPQAGGYDAIVTHFFLDCFPPQALEAVVAALATGASPRALWVVADFALPARGPARWRAQAVHALMYAFFRRATRLPARRVTPPGPLLARHGFALRCRQPSEWGLLRSDLWSRDSATPRA